MACYLEFVRIRLNDGHLKDTPTFSVVAAVTTC